MIIQQLDFTTKPTTTINSQIDHEITDNRCYFVLPYLGLLLRTFVKKIFKLSKNMLVVQVLNSKLGITIRVSVTSATILTAKRSADVTETRIVIPSLEFTCMTIKS